MANIEVFSSQNGQHIQNIKNNLVVLNQNSIVRINADIGDVANIVRSGQSAVITLKSGQVIVIENYFDFPLDQNRIEFQNGEKLYWAEFTDDAGSLLNTIKYHPLGEAVASEGGSIWPWVAGIAAVGGIAAAAGGGGGGSGGGSKDTTSPQLLTSVVDSAGDKITLTFNEPLDQNSVPPNSSFVVIVDGNQLGDNEYTVVIDGNKVVINPNDPIYENQIVEVIYTDPAGNQNSGVIQDKSGNDVSSFESDISNGSTVVNPDAPTLESAVVNTEGTAITLTFSESLDTNSVPPSTAFEVEIGGVIVVPADYTITVVGETVVITPTTPIYAGQTVEVRYTDAAGNQTTGVIQDAAGNDVASFDEEADNGSIVPNPDVTAPTLASITLNSTYDEIILTFDEPLDTNSVPISNAFEIEVDGTILDRSAYLVKVVGETVLIELNNAVTANTPILVTYTDPAGNTSTGDIQDAAGNDVMDFTAGLNQSSLMANDDEYELDMGQELPVNRVPITVNNVDYIELIGGNQGNITGVNFTVPQNIANEGKALTGNITITASQQDFLSVSEAFQVIVYQNVNGIQTEVARVGTQGGLVTLGGVGILGIVNDVDGIAVTLSDLPEGEYTAVVAKDDSVLFDLIYGIQISNLGGEGAILGTANQTVILDAIDFILGPLGGPVKTLVQAILLPVNTIGLPISSVVNQLLDVLPVAVLDKIIDDIVRPLVNNTLTIYENTDITITGTEEIFQIYTLTSNVFSDNGNGNDVAPTGTVISEIDGSAVSGTSVTIHGDYGTLLINTLTGEFTYTVTAGEEAIGKTEIFNYTIKNGTDFDSAKIIIDLDGTPVNDVTPPGYVGQVVANNDLATVQNYYETVGDEINQTGGVGGLLNASLLGIPISLGTNTPFNFVVDNNEISDVEITVTGSAALGLLNTLLGTKTKFDAVLQRTYIDEFGDRKVENIEFKNAISLDLVQTNPQGNIPIYEYRYIGQIVKENLLPGTYVLLLKESSESVGLLQSILNLLGTNVSLFTNIEFEMSDQTSKFLGSNQISGNVINSPDGADLVNSTTFVKQVLSEVAGATAIAIDDANTVIQGAYGKLYISPNGTYKYVSNGDVTDIGKVDTFTYTIRDFNGSTDTAQLNIRIDGEGLITWPSDPAQVGDDQVVLVNATNDLASIVTERLAHKPTTNETLAVTSLDTTGLTSFDAPLTGLGVATRSLKFNVADKDGVSALKSTILLSETSNTFAGGEVVVKLKDSSGNLIGSMSSQLFSTYTVLPGNGSSEINIDFRNLTLNSGQYTIELDFSNLVGSFGNVILNLTANSVLLTKVDLDEYQSQIVSTGLTTSGNIFTDQANDTLGNKFTTFTMNGKTFNYMTGNETFADASGSLVINGQGDYTYTSYVSNVNVSFDYTLTSISGNTSNATLTIGVAKEFISTAFNDVISTYSNGGDTVIYDLLNPTSSSGGNGTDIWKDFNADQGDTIDITALLAGQDVTSANLSNFVSVTQQGANTVVSLDRDGSASDLTYNRVDLIVLENTNSTSLVLDDLIKYHH